MVSGSNSTASAAEAARPLGRDRKVSLRVVRERVWGEGTQTVQVTGWVGRATQELPVEGVAWDEHPAARTPLPGGGSSVGGGIRKRVQLLRPAVSCPGAHPHDSTLPLQPQGEDGPRTVLRERGSAEQR